MKQAIQKTPLFVPFQPSIADEKLNRSITAAMISVLIAITVLAYFSNKHDEALRVAQQNVCEASKNTHQ